MSAAAPAPAAPAVGAPAASVAAPAQLAGLQVLRFVAALMVVLFHVGSGLQVEFGLAANPFATGASGVDIFFVLSGFIIAYTTDPARGAGWFLKRRIARVAPLYWFLTTLVAAIAVVAPQLLNSTVVSAEALVKSYLFIPYQKDNGFVQPLLFLGWTLCYEMYFYVVFAACLFAGRAAPLLACLVIGTAVALGSLVESESVLWRFYTNPITWEFALGILLHEAVARRPGGIAPSARIATGFIAAGFALLLLLPDEPRLAGQGLPAVLVVAGGLFLAVPQTVVGRLLVRLGDASYSLYLAHPYIIQLPIKVLGGALGFIGTAAVAFLSVVAALVASVVLYRMVERPAQKEVLKRLTRPRGAPVRVAIAPRPGRVR